MRSNLRYKIGLVGSGSWATAIAKILTDNHFRINWWMHGEEDIRYMQQRRHNPRYLSSVSFDLKKLALTNNMAEVIRESDWIVICVPSAFVRDILAPLPRDIFGNKSVVSAIKGIIPGENLLLNDYLEKEFKVQLQNYFSITGPCHAEEVALERLSYITITGKDYATAKIIAKRFTTPYLKTIVNNDIRGAQFAAVLKNVYAIGAGIAHSLGYGDNFLSVLIANCANEMTAFNDAVNEKQQHPYPKRNPFASAYLGDLLVTCYSQYSRNRTFGTMIGKGYSVKTIQLEMNMIAEGYYAVYCLHQINKAYKVNMPICRAVYAILYENHSPQIEMKLLSEQLT